MKVYRFPPLTPARLFRESAVSYYLRALKYPNFDKPFTRLNLATMDWPPLLGLCLAQLRHRYSDYESRLAAGEDREMLHREIHAPAFHAFPWLRADPRPLPPPPARLALDEAAATLAHLKDFEHSLTETLGSPGVRNSRKSRESVKEMIVKLRAEIAELTAILTQQRISEEGAVCSFGATATGADYDWLGHRLYPNSIRYLGFKCPGCGAGVYTSKRPLPIGQGQLAIVASCFCVTHFTPAVDGRKFEPVTLVRWVGFVEQVTAMAEEETPNRASTA